MPLILGLFVHSCMKADSSVYEDLTIVSANTNGVTYESHTGYMQIIFAPRFRTHILVFFSYLTFTDTFPNTQCITNCQNNQGLDIDTVNGRGCIACPIHQVTNITNNNICICNVAFSEVNSNLCTPCRSGKFKDTTKNGACVDCTIGKYLDQSGVFSGETCLLCEPPLLLIPPLLLDGVTMTITGEDPCTIYPRGFDIFDIFSKETYYTYSKCHFVISHNTQIELQVKTITKENPLDYMVISSCVSMSCNYKQQIFNEFDIDGVYKFRLNTGFVHIFFPMSKSIFTSLYFQYCTPGDTFKNSCVLMCSGQHNDMSDGYKCKHLLNNAFLLENDNAVTTYTCNIDFIHLNHSFCTGCPTGKYQMPIDNFFCTDCTSGKYSMNISSTTCADCIIGKFAKNSGQSSCT